MIPCGEKGNACSEMLAILNIMITLLELGSFLKPSNEFILEAGFELAKSWFAAQTLNYYTPAALVFFRQGCPTCNIKQAELQS